MGCTEPRASLILDGAMSSAKFVGVNRACCELFGFNGSEFQGRGGTHATVSEHNADPAWLHCGIRFILPAN